jgi:thiamine-monophosphate kinase
MNESEVIERLRRMATDPAARGLADDAALLDGLVITHDSLAEGVHFLSSDPPASVGWKLIAVNLSDLAGKGATPAGALLSFPLSDADWDRAVIDGIEAACESYGLPLIGGDTITLPAGSARVYGLTAIGRAGKKTPSRTGGSAEDDLWVAGSLGDSAAGLSLLEANPRATGALVDTYRRPIPLLQMGRQLAVHASAMMDVSDGLLIDLAKLCSASRCGAEIELDLLPLSSAFVAERGQDRRDRLFAATAGDDYALLAAIPAGLDPVRLSLPEAPNLTRIGKLVAGSGLKLHDREGDVPLPERLGYEHRASASAVPGGL